MTDQTILKVMYRTEPNGPWSPVDLPMSNSELDKLKQNKDKAAVKSTLLNIVSLHTLGQEVLEIDYKF